MTGPKKPVLPKVPTKAQQYAAHAREQLATTKGRSGNTPEMYNTLSAIAKAAGAAYGLPEGASLEEIITALEEG